MRRIPLTRSAMPSFEDYCEELRDLWDSHWLTNMGQKHARFQRRLEAYLGVPRVTLFTNGHLALEGALAALELPPGGEVITTPFTFASTTHAIVRRGLTPVFCDILPDELTMDPARAEALITERTVALLPVHVYGRLCDVDALADLAARRNLKLVYDAAHAFGVRRGDRSAAAFGNASVFSFHASKVFNTIEGGAVTTADPALAQRLALEKNFGIANAESTPAVGGNAKMNEFQAAMGLCNMRHLQEEIAGRKAVYEHYEQLLRGVQGVRLLDAQEDVESNYAYLPVFFDHQAVRDRVCDALAREDVFARKYFYPLVSDFECYQGRAGFDSARTPVAKALADTVLTLPLYPGLAPEDVEHIAQVVRREAARG